MLAAVVGVLVAGCTDSPPSNTTADASKTTTDPSNGTTGVPGATPPTDQGAGDAAREPVIAPPMTCQKKSLAIIDYLADAAGKPNVQALFERRARPGETVVIIKHGPPRAIARFVDKDNTTQAEVMAFDYGNGYLIKTVNRCA